MMPAVPSVGIVGASGYTGAELLRLLAAHPAEVAVATAGSMAGRRAAAVFPSLAGAYPDLDLVPYAADALAASTWSSAPCPTG